MDIEYTVGLVVLVGAPLAWWGYQRYKTLMADGKITLSEVMETVDDAQEQVEEAKDKAEDLKEKSKSKKKAKK